MNNTNNVINTEYNIIYFYMNGCGNCKNFNKFLDDSKVVTKTETAEYIENIPFKRIESAYAKATFNQLTFDDKTKEILDGFPTVFFLKNGIVQTEYTMIGMSEDNAKKFLLRCEQISDKTLAEIQKEETSTKDSSNNHSSGAGSVCGK